MNKQVKGFVAGILAAVFYGTNPLGALPLYADGINCGTVLFYRYGLAMALFALVLTLKGERLGITRREALHLGALGGVFALSSLTLFESFLHMDAGLASTLLFCYPIMTAVIMMLMFHERLTLSTLLAIALAMGGIGLLYHGGAGARVSTLGFALVMLSSLLYAIYIVAVNQWKSRLSSLKFTFWVILFGWITVVAYGLVMGQPIQLLHGTRQWACAVQLAVLPTVLSLLLMTVSIKYIGSTPAAIMGALEPVTAVAIGVCLFGEAFTLRFAVGIVLILMGVLLVITRGHVPHPRLHLLHRRH